MTSLSSARSLIAALVVISKRADRGSVQQHGAHNLGRVDHASSDQVLVGVRCCVEAERYIHLVEEPTCNDSTIIAGIFSDLSISVQMNVRSCQKLPIRPVKSED